VIEHGMVVYPSLALSLLRSPSRNLRKSRPSRSGFERSDGDAEHHHGVLCHRLYHVPRKTEPTEPDNRQRHDLHHPLGNRRSRIMALLLRRPKASRRLQSRPNRPVERAHGPGSSRPLLRGEGNAQDSRRRSPSLPRSSATCPKIIMAPD